MTNSIPDLFTKSPGTEAAYGLLLDLVAGLPDVRLEVKKTCIHLATSKAAFLGVHPRKNGLRLTIPLERALPEGRVVKCEQVSAKRFHNEVDLIVGQTDPELQEWIAEAHTLKQG